MSAAFVIEIRGRQAGLVVRDERNRFRFFSAVPEAHVLEGQTFSNPAQASRAVRAALEEAPRR